jgi:hypothetical protein
MCGAGVMCQACVVGYGKDVNNGCSQCLPFATNAAVALGGVVETLIVVAILVQASMAPSAFRLNAARASNNIKVCARGLEKGHDLLLACVFGSVCAGHEALTCALVLYYVLRSYFPARWGRARRCW